MQLSESSQHGEGCDWQPLNAHPFRCERIVDRIEDRGRRTAGAGFAGSLRSNHRALIWRLDMRHLDVRHLVGHRYEIVGERSRDELYVDIVAAGLEQRLYEAHCRAASDIHILQPMVDN